jgi:hypothetical protein
VTDGLNDPKRLASLAESGLVGSSPEAAFDRVTRLVAEVLHVPVALFTLVTDERQMFKSSVGVGDLHESPLSHSFCRHVVESGAPLEVVVSAACGALSSDEHAVGCRAATVEIPREARSVTSVLRLADARLARYGHVASARA